LVPEDLHDHREWQKLLFDFYKHFTTLSTAAALVLLAIYQGDMLQGKVVVAAAVCFTLSTLFSLYGLTVIVMVFPWLPRPSLFRPRILPIPILPTVVAGFFGAGVVVVLEHIARLPLKYVNIALVVMMAGWVVTLIVLYFKYLKGQR
jgi:hypothetical protein